MPSHNIAGKKSRLRLLLPMVAAIAIPVACQNLLTTTGSMIDTMMLASLGENTVGAVGLCAQFSSLMFAGYWGFVGGGMLFISQFWGSGNHDGIEKTYGMTFAFMMISAILCGSAAVFFPDQVMHLYTNSEPIRAIGVQYLRIAGFSFPLQVYAMAMSTLLRSTERVKIPLIGGIAGVISNCLINWLLIFGRFGLPCLGVRGAALGTVFSCLVNIGVVLVCCKARRVPFIFSFRNHFRWDWPLLREYLIKCFPILMNEVLIGVGNMMINIVLGHQVEAAVAATAVFRTLEGLIIAFFSGFSNAATVLVGKEVGAGEHEEAFERAWRLVYMCSLLIAAAGLLLNLVRNPLLHAMGLSGDSYAFASGMLVIYGIVAVIRMGNWAMNDTYRSAGDSAFGSTMEIVFMFCMVQPVIQIANGVFHAPFLLVFALCYCDEPIRYLIMQKHLYSRKWIRPVSAQGQATIEAFRKKYHVVVKESSHA